MRIQNKTTQKVGQSFMLDNGTILWNPWKNTFGSFVEWVGCLWVMFCVSNQINPPYVSDNPLEDYITLDKEMISWAPILTDAVIFGGEYI